MEARVKGTVAWFNNAKGFGFIKMTDGKDIFCHYSNINASGYKSLDQGDVVEFGTEKVEKGWQAIDIEVIDKANPEAKST